MRRSATPGHVAKLFEQTHGELAVAFDVAADDLDVDRRGQTEVQDLADDVGRQESRT